MDRLNTLLTEEVNKIQKEIKELRKKAEEIQTEASSKKEPTEPEAGQVQLKELDSNFSRLSEIVENLQGRLTSQQENSALEVEQVQVSIRGLRKGLDTLSHESKQSGALGMIDKQRRGWEEAREKAEQMSQIFDSLIITNDRPYVSCGLELPATCPGLIDFAQFELINKVPVKQSRKPCTTDQCCPQFATSKERFKIVRVINIPPGGLGCTGPHVQHA